MATNVLLLGSTGVLGSQVLRELSKEEAITLTAAGREIPEVYANSKTKFLTLDVGTFLSGQDVLKFREYDVVVNCIGAIKQKGFSQSEMYCINSIFPKLIALEVKNSNTKVLNFSTDCVFTGIAQDVYDENRTHDARDAYGFSKSLGEIKQENIFNIRCSFVGNEKKSNFSLLSWFRSQKPNAVISGYSRQFWNGLGNVQYAKMIRSIVAENCFDIPNSLNLIPKDYVSKFELLDLFRNSFNRLDIKVIEDDQAPFIYRVLSTAYPEVNEKLWKLAGYEQPATIEMMIREVANEASV